MIEIKDQVKSDQTLIRDFGACSIEALVSL